MVQWSDPEAGQSEMKTYAALEQGLIRYARISAWCNSTPAFTATIGTLYELLDVRIYFTRRF